MKEDLEDPVEIFLNLIEIEKKGVGILIRIRNRSKNSQDHLKVREWIHQKIKVIREDQKRFKKCIRDLGI